jgi:hypothetical protein
MNIKSLFALTTTLLLSASPFLTAVEIGNLDIGGAIRANYVYGDYTSDGSDAAQRGDNGGNFALDVFRINLDYAEGPFTAKAEYRWYNGYNMLHTGWVGFDLNENSNVQVGLNRVPFGVGAYGPANSWFFDQHYYVGLSDDMDYGIKYSWAKDNLAIDFAYYLMAENSFVGATDESARYSYDIVDNGSPYSHYEEENQINLRAVYTIQNDNYSNDLGISAQWSQLDADDAFAEDSDAYAVSLHSKASIGPWTLMLQATQYEFSADYNATATDENGVPLTNDLITMGAYDFAWPVASKGIIPAVALSYTVKPDVEWIDSITFYNDYSVIMKDNDSFNDSAMNVTGFAIANGGWYIYVDYAYSNGNYFVGNEGDVYGDTYLESSVGDFGANGNDDWNGRFNINFGYYF